MQSIESSEYEEVNAKGIRDRSLSEENLRDKLVFPSNNASMYHTANFSAKRPALRYE